MGVPRRVGALCQPAPVRAAAQQHPLRPPGQPRHVRHRGAGRDDEIAADQGVKDIRTGRLDGAAQVGQLVSQAQFDDFATPQTDLQGDEALPLDVKQRP